MAYLHLIQKFLARQSKYYNWKVKSFDLDLFWTDFVNSPDSVYDLWKIHFYI